MSLKKMPISEKRTPHSLLDLISDHERFFRYGQDLGMQILQCLFAAGKLTRCESFHPGVTFSIPPASHICPVCSKCSEIWRVGIL